MIKKRFAVVKQQVFSLSAKAEQEYQELEYIVNKILTSVDFIASQAQDTITKWKSGEVYRRSSLDDLKFKFRLDTFSVEDGWGLFYLYPDWIKQQRQKLHVLVGFIHSEAEEIEDLITAIGMAEQAEWAKGVEMDMDVIFTLREMKKIFHITEAMEPKLKQLEVACKKRSTQIMAPAWEPKGLL